MNKIINFLRSQNPRLLLATITVIAVGIIALLGFGLQRYLANKNETKSTKKTVQQTPANKPKTSTPSVPTPSPSTQTPAPTPSVNSNIAPAKPITSPPTTTHIIRKQVIVKPTTRIIRITPVSATSTTNSTSAAASAIAPGACAFAYADPNGASASTTCP